MKTSWSQDMVSFKMYTVKMPVSKVIGRLLRLMHDVRKTHSESIYKWALIEMTLRIQGHISPPHLRCHCDGNIFMKKKTRSSISNLEPITPSLLSYVPRGSAGAPLSSSWWSRSQRTRYVTEQTKHKSESLWCNSMQESLTRRRSRRPRDRARSVPSSTRRRTRQRRSWSSSSSRCYSQIPYCVSQLLHNFFGLGVFVGEESASAVVVHSRTGRFCPPGIQGSLTCFCFVVTRCFKRSR